MHMHNMKGIPEITYINRKLIMDWSPAATSIKQDYYQVCGSAPGYVSAVVYQNISGSCLRGLSCGRK